MAAAPTKEAIKGLYTQMLSTSRSFSSYNFREYFVRRTEATFKEMQTVEDTEKLTSMYTKAVNDLAVLRRSALVNQIYGGWKLAVEANLNEGKEGSSMVRESDDRGRS